MNDIVLPALPWGACPWWLAGALLGLWLVPLARIIPLKVLQGSGVALHEWQGPGGGLEQPVPPFRRIWVPLVNACLWGCAANTSGHPALLAVLLGACLSTSLVLLALIDWDTTLLPDCVVLPLGMAGLAASSAGLAPQSLPVSAASAAVVLCLLGGLSWLFRLIRGDGGIGGGDIKLLAALAAWRGAGEVLYVLFWAGVVTVGWFLVWRRFRGLDCRADWPFGPAIAVAALAGGLPIWGR